jgi:hypothetical protein
MMKQESFLGLMHDNINALMQCHSFDSNFASINTVVLFFSMEFVIIIVTMVEW